MNIEWNKVTWYSKILAIIIFVGTFFLGFRLGQQYGEALSATRLSKQPIINQTPAVDSKLGGEKINNNTKYE